MKTYATLTKSLISVITNIDNTYYSLKEKAIKKNHGMYMASDAKEINAVIEELNIKRIALMHEFMLTVIEREYNVKLSEKELMKLENYEDLYYFVGVYLKDNSEKIKQDIIGYTKALAEVLKNGFYNDIKA